MKKISTNDMINVVGGKILLRECGRKKEIFVGNKIIPYEMPLTDDYTHYKVSIYKDFFIKDKHDFYLSLTDVSGINRNIPRDKWDLDDYRIYVDSNNMSCVFADYHDYQSYLYPLVIDATRLTKFILENKLDEYGLVNFLNKYNEYVYKNIKNNLDGKYAPTWSTDGIIEVSRDNLDECIKNILLNENDKNISLIYQDKVRNRKRGF